MMVVVLLLATKRVVDIINTACMMMIYSYGMIQTFALGHTVWYPSLRPRVSTALPIWAVRSREFVERRSGAAMNYEPGEQEMLCPSARHPTVEHNGVLHSKNKTTACTEGYNILSQPSVNAGCE